MKNVIIGFVIGLLASLIVTFTFDYVQKTKIRKVIVKQLLREALSNTDIFYLGDSIDLFEGEKYMPKMVTHDFRKVFKKKIDLEKFNSFYKNYYEYFSINEDVKTVLDGYYLFAYLINGKHDDYKECLKNDACNEDAEFFGDLYISFFHSAWKHYVYVLKESEKHSYDMNFEIPVPEMLKKKQLSITEKLEEREELLNMYFSGRSFVLDSLLEGE